MSAPDISILMCVRNGERYLGAALDSVASEPGCANRETIIVDDGSTDSSVAIAQAHAIGARIVRQAALGVPSALNRCVAEARGKLVAFIDSDDVWPAGRLAALMKAFDDSPLLDGAFGEISNTDADLKPLTAPFPARLLTSALIRRSAFERVGTFRTDVRHAANVDWISRAEALGLHFGAVKAPVLLRRVHGSNMGIADASKGRSDMLRVIRDHHARKRR